MSEDKKDMKPGDLNVFQMLFSQQNNPFGMPPSPPDGFWARLGYSSRMREEVEFSEQRKTIAQNNLEAFQNQIGAISELMTAQAKLQLHMEGIEHQRKMLKLAEVEKREQIRNMMKQNERADADVSKIQKENELIDAQIRNANVDAEINELELELRRKASTEDYDD